MRRVKKNQRNPKLFLSSRNREKTYRWKWTNSYLMKAELASEALRAIPSFALKRKSHGFDFVQRRVRDSNAILKYRPIVQ